MQTALDIHATASKIATELAKIDSYMSPTVYGELSWENQGDLKVNDQEGGDDAPIILWDKLGWKKRTHTGLILLCMSSFIKNTASCLLFYMITYIMSSSMPWVSAVMSK